MSTNKKKTTTTALNAITAWQSAVEREKEAIANRSVVLREVSRERGTSTRTDEQRLREVIAEIAHAEAEDARRAAERQAGAAIDADEVAAGDELAVSRDPAVVHVDLVACRAEVRKLEAQVQQATARFVARLAQAHQATDAIAARRAGQALPPPHPLPTIAPDLFGRNTSTDPDLMIAAIERLATEAPAVPANPEKLARLRSEEQTLRAQIEQRRLDEEEREKRHAAHREAVAEENARRAKAEHAEHAAHAARLEVDAKKKRDLADAHRARTGT